MALVARRFRLGTGMNQARSTQKGIDMGEDVERDDMEEQETATQEIVAEDGTVTVDSKALESVTAETVNIESGGAQKVEATTVHVTQGGIAVAQAETITVQEGGIAIARGTNVTVNGGGAFLVAAEHAEVHESSVVFLAAQEVSGDAKILFDVKAAVLFGVIVGLVVGLLKQFAGRKE